MHGLVLIALLRMTPSPLSAPDPPPVNVQLVALTPPQEPTKAPAAAAAAPVKPLPPRRKLAKPRPAPPDVATLPAAEGDADLGDTDLVSAATAGSGGSGGGCDMTRWLQNALRKDRRVLAALAEVQQRKAITVWNGDWIRRSGQDGNGLAAVREAIMWEVGFAPVTCRSERMHGLVLISLGDSPGSARIVVGSGVWRWSDLLFAERGVTSRP